jgi:hypothetical protein
MNDIATHHECKARNILLISPPNNCCIIFTEDIDVYCGPTKPRKEVSVCAPYVDILLPG